MEKADESGPVLEDQLPTGTEAPAPPPIVIPDFNQKNGSIVYRNSYETREHARKLVTPSFGALSVAEAKVLIAKELGLQKDFARTFDLRLVDVTDGKHEDLVDDSRWILPGSSLVVHRTLWRPVSVVHCDTVKNLGDWKRSRETTATVKSKSMLDSLTCAYCSGIVQQPVLARCVNKCNKSLCRICADALLASSNFAVPSLCPGCNQKTVKGFIPNKALALLAQRLDRSSINSAGVAPSAASTSLAKTPLTSKRQSEQHTSQHASEGSTSPALAQCGWLLILHANQLNLIHKHSVLVFPLEKDSALCAQIFQRPNQDESPLVYIVAKGGGGTSLVSAGVGKLVDVFIQNIENTDPTDDTDDKNVPWWPPPNSTSEITADQASNFLKLWYGSAESLPQISRVVFCRVDWSSRFSAPVLLPGKAQPLAGIIAAAPPVSLRCPDNPSATFSAISLTASQTTGIGHRLCNEAHFSKTPSSNPQLSQLTSLPDLISAAIDGHTPSPGNRALQHPISMVQAQNTPAASEASIPSPQFTLEDKCRAIAEYIRRYTKRQALIGEVAGYNWPEANPLLPWIGLHPVLTEEQFSVLKRLQALILGKPLQPAMPIGESKEVDATSLQESRSHPNKVPNRTFTRPTASNTITKKRIRTHAFSDNRSSDPGLSANAVNDLSTSGRRWTSTSVRRRDVRDNPEPKHLLAEREGPKPADSGRGKREEGYRRSTYEDSVRSEPTSKDGMQSHFGHNEKSHQRRRRGSKDDGARRHEVVNKYTTVRSVEGRLQNQSNEGEYPQRKCQSIPENFKRNEVNGNDRRNPQKRDVIERRASGASHWDRRVDAPLGSHHHLEKNVVNRRIEAMSGLKTAWSGRNEPKPQEGGNAGRDMENKEDMERRRKISRRNANPCEAAARMFNTSLPSPAHKRSLLKQQSGDSSVGARKKPRNCIFS